MPHESNSHSPHSPNNKGDNSNGDDNSKNEGNKGCPHDDSNDSGICQPCLLQSLIKYTDYNHSRFNKRSVDIALKLAVERSTA